MKKGPRAVATKDVAKTARPMTKRQLSRHQRDMRRQRIAKTAFVALLSFVVLIIAFGFWRELIAPAGEAILRVRGVPIKTEVFAKVLGYRQFEIDNQIAQMRAFAAQSSGGNEESAALTQQLVQQQLQQLQQLRSNLEGQVLEQMIDEQLIGQEAAKKGITVSASDIDAAILKEYTPPEQSAESASVQQTPQPGETPAAPTATPQPTATPISREQALANKQKDLATIGLLSETDYRELIVKPGIVRERLEKTLSDAVPSSAEQVWARHILVDTEQEAKDILGRLQGGGDFAALASELSKDPGSKEKGGDLGWFPRGTMIAEFDGAAFGLQVGQTVTEPVQTSYGYHIIQALGHEQNRPLAEDQLSRAKGSALEDWLQAQRASDPNAIEYGYSWERVRWARDWVAKNAKYLQPTKR